MKNFVIKMKILFKKILQQIQEQKRQQKLLKILIIIKLIHFHMNNKWKLFKKFVN